MNTIGLRRTKRRRNRGYLYKHNISGHIQRWDTYGQEEFDSVTGGKWILMPEEYWPFPW